jgi:O-acetylserine/cysteine efflux transporter
LVGASGILALAYGVVVSTFFGYGVWYWLISRYPASTVAPFTLLMPVVGILTRGSCGGASDAWGELLGSLVVLVGLGLALGVVDALAVPRRTAARVRAPPPNPGMTPRGFVPIDQVQPGGVYAELRHQM